MDYHDMDMTRSTGHDMMLLCLNAFLCFFFFFSKRALTQYLFSSVDIYLLLRHISANLGERRFLWQLDHDRRVDKSFLRKMLVFPTNFFGKNFVKKAVRFDHNLSWNSSINKILF